MRTRILYITFDMNFPTNLMQKLLEIFRKSLINDIPDAVAGNFRSRRTHYQNIIHNFYPEDGEIEIDSYENDKVRCSNDLRVVIRDYKVGAKKYKHQVELAK